MSPPKEVADLHREGDDLVIAYKDGSVERIKNVEFVDWTETYSNATKAEQIRVAFSPPDRVKDSDG